MVPITFEFVRVGTVERHYTSFVDMYNARAHIYVCIYLNEFLLKTFAFQHTFVNIENNTVMDLEENRKS